MGLAAIKSHAGKCASHKKKMDDLVSGGGVTSFFPAVRSQQSAVDSSQQLSSSANTNANSANANERLVTRKVFSYLFNGTT